jgi:haloacetate dehalogenase
MSPEAWADFTDAVHNPETVHAMLEDYRAGLTVDQHHDAADRRQGRRLNCPTHVLWATGDDLPELYGDPRDVWREWGDHVTGRPIEGSHHLAEVASEELVSALQEFLARS